MNYISSPKQSLFLLTDSECETKLDNNLKCWVHGRLLHPFHSSLAAYAFLSSLGPPPCPLAQFYHPLQSLTFFLSLLKDH